MQCKAQFNLGEYRECAAVTCTPVCECMSVRIVFICFLRIIIVMPPCLISGIIRPVRFSVRGGLVGVAARLLAWKSVASTRAHIGGKLDYDARMVSLKLL